MYPKLLELVLQSGSPKETNLGHILVEKKQNLLTLHSQSTLGGPSKFTSWKTLRGPFSLQVFVVFHSQPPINQDPNKSLNDQHPIKM